MTEELLAFERRWLNDPRASDGRKAQAIQAEFGVSETRHYQRLVAVLHTDEAWRADPATTSALLGRLKARTRARRSG
ncbi:DUF3263 domain-containing protein [Intrasporangium flavum]|uniref:DUF3263 domain-containing protein n=1 Tax=Intrasporangium flavum TaxID=1428657 RepID=UPI0009F849D2|nr:DUF3263 domain-containing protein [Intrasporangium flavum]